MAREGIDDKVLEVVRDYGRPVRFAEVAKALEERGASRSQVHNALYRLGRKGRLRRSGAGTAMTYTPESAQ